MYTSINIMYCYKKKRVIYLTKFKLKVCVEYLQIFILQ